MIRVNLNIDKYQYDIHSLFKAFYGNEDVKVIVSGSSNDEGDYFAHVNILTEEENPDLVRGKVVVSAGLNSKEIIPVQKEVAYIDHLTVSKNENASTSGDTYTVDTSKNAVKKAIYQALREVTKRDLPWGNLTGIRPTRIAMNLIDNGKSDEEIFEYMKNTYFVSDEKIRLSISIARREKEILKEIDYENGYSLYIGIPFCPTTCLYCSFTSYPIGAYSKIVDDYISCLEKEIVWTIASISLYWEVFRNQFKMQRGEPDHGNRTHSEKCKNTGIHHPGAGSGSNWSQPSDHIQLGEWKNIPGYCQRDQNE